MNSRRHLWITHSDRTLALIYPACEGDLPSLEILLAKLTELWLEAGCTTTPLLSGAGWAIARSILHLIPHAPHLPINLKLLKADPALFTQLFFPQSENRPGRITELHLYDLPQRAIAEPWTPERDLTIADLPFPTSESRVADNIALMFYNFQPPDALSVLKQMDAETRSRVQMVLAELNRPADERIAEYSRKCFNEWRRQNEAEFQKSIYEDW